MGSRLHIRALPIVIGAALLFVAPSAWAVTFDFGQFANDHTGYSTDLGPTDLEGSYSSFTIGREGITITVSAYSPSGGANPDAYLDGFLGGDANLPGGLGACPVGTSCAGNSEDNVTNDEALMLVFSEPVILQDVFFRNQVHETDPFPTTEGDPTVDIASDETGGIPGGLTGYILNSNHLNLVDLNPGDNGLKGTTFYFQYNNTDFYIEQLNVVAQNSENPIPEPATLGLLGTGLLGLVARSRRRRS